MKTQLTPQPNPQLIIVDEAPSYRRVALLQHGVLDQIWIDDDERGVYQPGALVAVRIGQIFPQHQRASVSLDNIEGSLRLPSDAEHLKTGQIIPALIISDARQDALGKKPLQLKYDGTISRRDLPQKPALITPAPDALTRARTLYPDAEIIHDRDGTLWNQYDLDLALEDASHITLPHGAKIILSTPPGATVIDIDSATSKLAPLALAEASVPHIFRQLRLCRIGGPIVIDFPRLDKPAQQKIHQLIRLEAKNDPLKIALHGFTKGGLYTLARPWRDRLLSDEKLSPLHHPTPQTLTHNKAQK